MIFPKSVNLKNKVLVTWLLSYVLVLAIPLLVGSLLYVESSKIIEEEISQVQQASLDQLKSSLDSDLRDIKKISSALAVDSIVAKLSFKWDDFSPTDFYSMYTLQKSVRSLKVTNTTIDGIYIYFKRSGSILSHMQRLDSTTYGSDIMEDFQMSANDWIQMISAVSQETFQILSMEMPDGSLEKKVVYFHPVQLVSIKSIDAVIVMLIDGSYLEDVLENSSGNNGTMIAMVDLNNDFLSSPLESGLPAFMKYEALAKRSESAKTWYNDEAFTIIQSESEISGWKLVSAIPTNIYMAKVEYIRLILIAYIMIGLVGGLSISVYMALRNYKPLRKLTQFASNDAAGGKRSEANEFKYIEQIMRTLLQEKNSLKDRLEIQKNALRENFIGRLVKGNVSNLNTIVESCRMHDIHPIGNWFVVLVFQIESMSEIYSDDDPKDTLLVNFVIKTTAEELAAEKYCGFAAEVDGRICCVINFRDGSDTNVKGDIKEIADKSVDFLESNFGLTVTIAVSGVHANYPGLSLAYSEAMEVVEYNILVEDVEPVMLYDTLFHLSGASPDDSAIIRKENRISNLIVKRDFKQAADITDDILVNDIFKSAPSFQIVKYRVFGLLNTILNAIGQIRTSIDVDPFDDPEILQDLIASSSIKELREQIGDIFKVLIQNTPTDSLVESSEKFEKILAYVDQHYMEPDLSVSSISYQFDNNISYLSRMFKKEKGIGMLDYIHQLRIEKAKQLLSDSEMSIREIAQAVGYSNDIAIIRAFKRYEGITPGKYRETQG